MGPLPLTVLLLAALGAFAALAWRKLAIVVALQPEVRWDHPAARLRKVLTLGVAQTRMIAMEPGAGLLHAVIFLGFLVLLVRKVQLLVIGFDAGFVYSGVPGGLYAGLKDAVELAVTAAVLLALWRRYVLRPRRFEPNREALVVLLLILAIMVTDFAFDAFRFALLAGTDAGIAHERDFAFVGAALARLLSGQDPAALALGYHGTYWLQIVTVLVFLVLLPTGEHFHIVTALPALFFSRTTPLNRVPPVDLDRLLANDAPADLAVGVRTAADLTWKDGLDAFTCTECGRCKDACPTFLTGKPLALKWVQDGVKHHLLEQRAALVGGQPEHLPALVGSAISADALWACTTCGYCEHACPIELEHLGKWYRLRQHQVMMEGAFPPELRAVFDAYESQGNGWGLPAERRGDWARGLDLRVASAVAPLADDEWLFYVGSALSYDDRGQKVARAFVQVLRAAGVRFAILGAAEGSTGECVRRAGNEMLGQTLARALVDTLTSVRARRIVTCDPHAFNAIRNELPPLGGRYDVVHHTQLLDQLIGAGQLPLRAGPQRVIFHEPCYLGRHNGEYEAPRRVLAAVAGAAPLEFPLNRARAMCCGAGGARFWMEEHVGQRINVLRVEQALPQAPQLIATACPYCLTMMRDGAAALGQEAIVTRDIAELVADAIAAAEPRASGSASAA